MMMSSLTGAPVVRPMFFDFPEDENTFDLGGDQIMVGPALMAAPAVAPGVREVQVRGVSHGRVGRHPS